MDTTGGSSSNACERPAIIGEGPAAHDNPRLAPRMVKAGNNRRVGEDHLRSVLRATAPTWSGGGIRTIAARGLDGRWRLASSTAVQRESHAWSPFLRDAEAHIERRSLRHSPGASQRRL
jgi:hypothetical protein